MSDGATDPCIVWQQRLHCSPSSCIASTISVTGIDPSSIVLETAWDVDVTDWTEVSVP